MTTESQLARGLQILDLLAKSDMTAAEIASALDVNRSTGWRLVENLRTLGFVDRDPLTNTYHLCAERLYSMVQQRLDHSNWHKPVLAKLEAMRNDTGEATLLTVPGNGVMVYVGFFASVRTIAVREEIGTMRPIHSSASGKAYLSGLTSDALESEIAKLTFELGTPKAPKNADELRRIIRETRARGYSLDLGETSEDVSCLAVPIFLHDRVVAAAGVSGPTSRLPLSRVTTMGEQLKQQIELTGFGWPRSPNWVDTEKPESGNGD